MQRERLKFFLIIIMWLLTACDRGPEPDSLQQDLQVRLDSLFQQGLFSIREFRRTGSAPFQDMENDVSGIYAYFDAELELQEDYSLTDWRDLNLGSLAYAIGAKESGIEGIRAQGNKRGELLRVHGRFAYTHDAEGGWKPLDKLSGPEPAGGPEPAVDGNTRSPASVLRDARALRVNAHEFEPDTPAGLIVEELNSALERIDLRTARLEGKITLGSGLPPGTYYSFGEALAQYAEQRELPLFSAVSEGSIANVTRLQAGSLDFGIVQSDVAQLLYRGLTNEGFFPYKELRAVASLWPEAVHLVTLQGSGITQLSDLRGKRVAIGQRGSGSRINAMLIGLVARLNKDQLAVIREISLTTAIKQLERGEVEALFLTEAVPAPSLQALAARRDDLRFVPLPSELLAKLAERHFAYYPLRVPARTYPGQSEAFSTLGLAAALMTHRQVADDRVDKMLHLLLSGGDELARRYYRAAFISRETMRLGLAVPLHPAAERFYEDYDRRQASESQPAMEPANSLKAEATKSIAR